MSLGEKLKKLRGTKSMKDVSGDLGISVSALCMYESNERVPRDDIKLKIADYYKVDIGDLFFNR